MLEFKDLYLSTTPITDTFLNRKINGQEVTSDGKTKNTPLLEIKNLMVIAVKRTFAELEKTGKFSVKLMPSTVFGEYQDGKRKYDEVARFIVEDVIEFLNDQYGSYGKNGFESMFNKIFSTPLTVDGKKQYLRVYDDAIFKRTNKKVFNLMEQANYTIPLTDNQREAFKKIYRDAYYNLIEGTILLKNNEPILKKGEHIIVKKSDLQNAHFLIKNHINLQKDNFLENKNNFLENKNSEIIQK